MRYLMASSGKGAKNKGSLFELKISKSLSKWSGLPFYRSPASGAWASQRLGQDAQSGDIVAPQSIDFPFSIELKHHEGVSLDNFVHSTGEVPSFLTQAIGDAVRVNKIPILITHWNYHPNYISIPYSEKVLSDLKSIQKPYLVTTTKYKDSLTDEDLYIDLLTFIYEDFLELYSLDYLLKSSTYLFSAWVDLVSQGINSRKTGSKKEIKSTNVKEILDNL